jgi:transposase
VLQYHFNWKTISVAAGMTLWNFYFQIFSKAIGKEEVVEFLSHLLRHLAGPLLILWDRLPAHRSYLVADFVSSLEGWIEIEYLPAYAPELNPVNTFGVTGNIMNSPTFVPRTCGTLAKAPAEPCTGCVAGPA